MHFALAATESAASATFKSFHVLFPHYLSTQKTQVREHPTLLVYFKLNSQGGFINVLVCGVNLGASF